MLHPDHTEQFIRLFFAGAGMFLLGGVNLGLHRSRVAARVAANLAVVGFVLGGYAAWESTPGAVGRVAAVIGAGVLAALLAGSGWLVSFAAAALRVAHKPTARWGLLAAGGMGVIVYAAAVYTRTDDRLTQGHLDDLEMMVNPPTLAVSGRAVAKTDRGYEVVVRTPEVERDGAEIGDTEMTILRRLKHDEFVIRRGPATDVSNCHGWVFTGGRYWIVSESVEQILRDNAYAPVTDPRPGDLVVYRHSRGVCHSGLVRYVAAGQTPIIESKWGWMGLYLHPVEKSIYGTDYTFYRSPRDGHLIAGMK